MERSSSRLTREVFRFLPPPSSLVPRPPSLLIMASSSMTIAEFQKLIRDRYYKTDAARGAAATFLWFSEEVGELAQALGKHERGDPVAAELQDEFADVLAWLSTLASISGVDLEQAALGKYAEGCPRCGKTPCNCP